MNATGILNWLFTYLLEHEFHDSRRDMAAELRLGEQTFKNAVDEAQPAETALLFEQLLKYTLDHNIGIDNILNQYRQDQK